MKKGMIFIITLSFLIMVMPLYSFAYSPTDVPILSCSWHQPEVGYYYESNIYKYKFLFNVYDQQYDEYKIWYYILSSDTDFQITGFTPVVYPYRIPTLYFNISVLSVDRYLLNASDGHVVESVHDNITSGNDISLGLGEGIVPYAYGLFYYYDSVNTFPISSYTGYGSVYGGYATDYQFVQWNNIPELNIYRSTLSEPVCDPYNRYFILAGQEHKYLYWLSYKFDDYILAPFSNPNDENIYVHLSNLFYPKISINNNIQLSLNCSPDLLNWINSSLPTSVNNMIIYYDIVISCFDLESGKFINASKYDDCLLSTDAIIINYDFGQISYYDSVKSYGIYYENLSNNPLNLLSCIFSSDPIFENWKQSIENYLMLIYQAVSPEDFTDPTVDDSYESEVDNYIEEESSLLDHYNESVLDDAVNDFGDNIDLIYSDNQSGFLFVNHLFDEFVFNLTIPEICIMLSLIFGFIILVLGKSVIK